MDLTEDSTHTVRCTSAKQRVLEVDMRPGEFECGAASAALMEAHRHAITDTLPAEQHIKMTPSPALAPCTQQSPGEVVQRLVVVALDALLVRAVLLGHLRAGRACRLRLLGVLLLLNRPPVAHGPAAAGIMAQPGLTLSQNGGGSWQTAHTGHP